MSLTTRAKPLDQKPVDQKPVDRKQDSPILRRQLTDIDEITRQVQPFARVEMTQLSCERLDCDLMLATFPDIQFCFSTSSCPIKVIGEKLKTFVTFGLILEPQDGYLVSHNRRLSSDIVFGMNSHLEVNLVLPAHQNYVWIQVRQDVIKDYLKLMKRVDIDDQFWCNNFVIAPPKISTIKAYLRKFLRLTSQSSSFLKYPHINAHLLKDFISFLISAIPFQTKDLLNQFPTLKRAKLVKQAEDYMLAHLGQPITLKDICQALHVSSRPMFYGFQEMFGVSPMEYLKVQRLQRVRRSLQIAAPESNSVMGIAERYGFWSGGHFARDYKTMFGELPSETLKLEN
ncbi:MAG: helix-turn-helix domain-containing protein [Synechococcaceae cyanobacterium SM2_3_2]|nr:helix-turn-helix domain-containing protein [Synechococcaceae cyanobacterium SM2_3_2]